jgi:hypothetical protein
MHISITSYSLNSAALSINQVQFPRVHHGADNRKTKHLHVQWTQQLRASLTVISRHVGGRGTPQDDST